MTHLVCIRHGETDWNRQHRFQGQIDVPLNATGLAQAQRLAQRLAAEAPDLLFSSDLQRAWQTAAPLAGVWGLAPRPVPGLREQSFGVLEGLTVGTIQQEHPLLWREWLLQRGDFGLPGGESMLQFHARVLQAVRSLVQAHAGRRLVLVTHGGVLDMLWRTAGGRPLAGLRDCAIPNTGVNRLRWVDDTLVVDSWGDDSHLHDGPAR